MNQWAFVIAAYLLTFAAMAALISWSLFACRRAEERAERIGRRS
jgi:heme exporter protein CcmD